MSDTPPVPQKNVDAFRIVNRDKILFDAAVLVFSAQVMVGDNGASDKAREEAHLRLDQWFDSQAGAWALTLAESNERLRRGDL